MKRVNRRRNPHRSPGFVTLTAIFIAAILFAVQTAQAGPLHEAVKSSSDSGRIVIRAKANSWIQIRDDIGNKLVVTLLLRSGDSYQVPDRPGLKLLTGNAGALEVLVDGKVVPAIGGKGAVRRSIVLDVNRLLHGTAVVEGQRMARNWRPVKQAAPSSPSSPSAPQLAATPSAAAPQGLAGLQRQLKRIEGLVAEKPKPAPKPASAPKFPTKPVAVRFARVASRPDDIAVIIGNANYEKGKDIPDVTPAYADANGIRRYVKQALGVREENIIFLKDATQAEMISTFGAKDDPKGQLFNYVTPGKSRVFVYYSGHGAPGGKEGDSYIVPSNAQASTINLNGYPLKTLYRNLSKIPAKSMTVVLEACFSGASQAGTVISKASPIYLKAKDTGVPANITVIAAGAANQIASWEEDSSSDLFTEYFLKGMSGKADAKPYGNGDGKVEYAELGRYLKGTMTYFARRYYGREQTAQIVVGKGN